MPKVCLFALALATILIFATLLILTPKAHAADIKINEFLVDPSSGNQEWVEFHNPTGADLTGYFLDDDTDFGSDSGSSAKKSLSSINTSNSSFPYLEYPSSFLNNGGDFVVLFAADGSIVDQYQYTEDPGDDVSIGRSPDGSGSFETLANQTKGSPNSQPQPDPSPTPTASSSISNQSSTSSKSPNPTPKTTTTSSSTTKSPSPKSSPQILSEKTTSNIGESVNLIKDTSPSPSPSPEVQGSTPNTKVAAIFAGSGTILIGLALAAYWWYRRKNLKGEVAQ